MTTRQKLSLDDQLCFALFAATNALAQSYRPKLEEIGLTYPEYLVMLVIWQEGETTVDQIASRLSLSKPGAQRLAKSLEMSGYVEPRSCANDGDTGVERICLTEAGRDLEIGAARVWNGIVCQTQMDTEDLSRLRMDIMALTQRMKEESEDYKIHHLDNLLDLAK